MLKKLLNNRVFINSILWALMIIISLIIAFKRPILFLNENQILYLFSAASQVIAAIYGLIITGYIFLRNELDRKVEYDDTYKEIIIFLKKDNFKSITNISFITLLSISFCLLVISSATTKHYGILIFLINFSVSTVLIELILIVDFVIRMLNPNSLMLAGDKLKKQRAELSKKEAGETTVAGEEGDLYIFLKHYNNIENMLVENERKAVSSNTRRRLPNVKLVEKLFLEEKISLELKNNLMDLIPLRNILVHSSESTVSKKDIEFSNAVHNDLQTELARG